MYQLFIDKEGDYLIIQDRSYSSWYSNYSISELFTEISRIIDKEYTQQQYRKLRPKFICKFESLGQLKITHPELFI
ncbi:MAG: hypothetical protein PVF17_04455 [Ignavibacteria bacterium]